MTQQPVCPGGRPRFGGSGAVDAGSAALLATTMFFWGTAFRATAVGTRHATPIVFSTLRAAPATLALLVVVMLTRSRLPRDRRTAALGAVSGILTVTVSFEGIAEATKLAGPGNAAVLINTAPFFSVLLGRLVLRAQTPRVALAGLFVGFTGVVVMVSSQLGGGSVGRLAVGTAIALFTASGFAAGALIIAQTARRDPGLDMLGFTTLQYLTGLAGLAGLMVVYGRVGTTAWSSPALWESVAWVALGSSAVASIAFNLALRRVSAPRATAWQFMAPVVAVAVEAARGNEPRPLVILGIVLAIAGVAAVSIAQGTVPSLRA